MTRLNLDTAEFNKLKYLFPTNLILNEPELRAKERTKHLTYQKYRVSLDSRRTWYTKTIYMVNNHWIIMIITIKHYEYVFENPLLQFNCGQMTYNKILHIFIRFYKILWFQRHLPFIYSGADIREVQGT